MKTRDEIVTMAKAWDPAMEDGLREIDNALRARANLISERGAKLEWHLSWALHTLHKTARAVDASRRHVDHLADDVLGRLRGGVAVCDRDYLEAPDPVNLAVYRAQMALAQEMVNRLLDVYAALAAERRAP